MFDNFSKSIFIRTICSIFAALLIGLVCIFTGSYIIEKESLNKLKYLIENRSYQIEEPFEIVEKSADNLSYILSNMAYAKKINGNSHYSANYIEQMDSIIKKISNCHNNLIGIYVYLNPEYSFDKEQNTYFYVKSALKDTLKKQKVDKDIKDNLKNLYINIKKDDQGIWGDPYIDEFSGLYAISYAKPIILNNKLIGITKVNISMTDLVKFLSDLKVYNNGYAFLLDKNDSVISCPKRKTSKNIEKNNKLLLNLLNEKLKKENNGIISYKQNNIEMISGFFKQENGFIYVITAPKDEVFEQKYHLQRLITGIIFMGIILIILIVLNI